MPTISIVPSATPWQANQQTDAQQRQRARLGRNYGGLHRVVTSGPRADAEAVSGSQVAVDAKITDRATAVVPIGHTHVLIGNS